jgi:hypothetical protein
MVTEEHLSADEARQLAKDIRQLKNIIFGRFEIDRS